MAKAVNGPKHNVIVYSTSSCPYCHMAEEFLSSNGITFKEVNVGGDQKAAQEMIAKSGQMGVPVLDIDGTIIVGFDKPAIKAALGLE